MAEGGGLLNRCRVKSSTGGSNPPLSASNPSKSIQRHPDIRIKPQLILRFLCFYVQSDTMRATREWMYLRVYFHIQVDVFGEGGAEWCSPI